MLATCHTLIRAVGIPPASVIAIQTNLPVRDEIEGFSLVGQFPALSLRLFLIEFPQSAAEVFGHECWNA